MHARGRHALVERNRQTRRYAEWLERRFVLNGAPATLSDAYHISQGETLLARAAGQPTDVELLAEDFSSGASGLWSSSVLSQTPTKEGFLGRFGNDELRLSLTDLPTHGQVRLEFDLYVLQSWDGPGDRFTLSIAGGPTLVDTTFNNHLGGKQNYPSAWGGELHEAGTGAVSIDTLGYAHQGDAIYHFAFTLDHAARELTFVFAGAGLQYLDDESWGLDNAHVVLLERAPVGPVGVLANDTPAPGGTLSAELHSYPQHGQLLLQADGAFAYVPDAGYWGADSFLYVAHDGNQASAPTQVSIQIDKANGAPVAQPDEYSTPQGVALQTENSGESIEFADDFESTPSPAWTSERVSRTPLEHRGFLGDFGNESVSLRLAGLPAHGDVVVEFDLYLISSWDGSDQPFGPDLWTFGVVGEEPILATTFSNHDPLGGLSPHQNYPDAVGGVLHPAGTGAASIDTLGYGHQGDSVYHFRFVVPHVGGVLELIFAASGLQELGDESWGLDNVRVAVDGAGALANDHDPEGATLEGSLVQPPRFGTLAWNADGSFLYQPDAGFVGADTFTYRAFDGKTYSDVTPVTIVVFPAAPVAVDDQFVAPVHGALTDASVLSNDQPLSGRPATAHVVDEPLNGELSLRPDGQFTYVPRPGFRGADVFTYRLRDNIAESNLARVTIEVSQPTIVVGSHALAPDTPGQLVPILVEGPFDVSSLNLFAQVGDGGPELSQIGLPPGTRGPRITHVELAAGTIFSQAKVDVIPQPGLPQVAIVSASADAPARANGVLAFLTVDTTGLVDGTWELRLANVLPGLTTQEFDTNFGDIAADIVTGSLTVGPARVIGRRLFYNNSKFDGYDPAPNAADVAAIAPDKAPLFAGDVAGPTRVSSFVHGINGLAVDIQGALRTPLVQDFQFRVGQSGPADAWPVAPSPSGLMVLHGQGEAGSDRVLLTWPDGAIKNQWLQVTLRASPSLGLVADDVFLFGSLVGDSLQASFGDVDEADLAYLVANPRGPLNPAGLAETADFDRDGLVNATDLAIAQLHLHATLAQPLAVSSTVPGDANGDGQVSLVDFAILKAHFGGAGDRSEGDLNGDGIVDLDDFQQLKLHFGSARGQ